MDQDQALRARKVVMRGLNQAITQKLHKYLGVALTEQALSVILDLTRPFVRAGREALITSATKQYRALIPDKPVSRPKLTRFSNDTWKHSVAKVVTSGDVFSQDHLDQIINKAEF